MGHPYVWCYFFQDFPFWMLLFGPSAVVHSFWSKILNTGSTSLCLVCILMLHHVFGTTFVKQTFLYHVILKIEGVLLLKMDMWRIEEASISHLVCILCILQLLKSEFSIYHTRGLSSHSPCQDSRGPPAQDGSQITKQYLNKSIQSTRKCLKYRSEHFLWQPNGDHF